MHKELLDEAGPASILEALDDCMLPDPEVLVKLARHQELWIIVQLVPYARCTLKVEEVTFDAT